MKIRGHGSALAISLAALAVVIAGTSAAVAAVATTVNIVDPTTPSRAAKVNSFGQLSVTGATARINSTGLLGNYHSEDNFITSPTTASIAINRIMVSETAANAGAAGNLFRIYLYKNGVDSAGNCAGVNYVLLAIYQIAAGDTVVDPFSAPLVVGPTAGAKYCLNLFVAQLGSGSNLNYLPTYNFLATLQGGTYAGLGLVESAKPESAPASPAQGGDLAQ